jgi:hypothetical protein
VSDVKVPGTLHLVRARLLAMNTTIAATLIEANQNSNSP